MDTKRSQSLRKVATPQPSKTRMPPKTQSQASVTPSQTLEAGRGEKNPLDALSRSTARSAAYERRSGLQDIDEEYLKLVTMPPTTVPRHEHAAGKRTPQQPTLQGTNLARNVGGAETTQQQQPQQQQQQQQQPVQQTGQQQQMNNPQEQLMAQQAQQSAVTSQQMTLPTSQPLQSQQMPSQQMPPQQVTYMPAAGEPELCTTCPHCQTTIYLARAPEPVQMQTVAGIHGQPEGAGLTAAKQ